MSFMNLNLAITVGIIVTVAAMVYGWHRRRGALEKLVGTDLRKSMTSSLDQRKRLLRNLLGLLSILLLCFAVWRVTNRLQAAAAGNLHETEAVLLIADVSRSMLTRDMPDGGSRLEAARAWLRQTVRAAPGQTFALIVFAGDAFLECPFTRDQNTLHYFIDGLTPGSLPVQGTDIARALALAGEVMTTHPRAESGRVTAFLFTDGGDPEDDLENLASAIAAALPGPLHVFGLGAADRDTTLSIQDGTFLQRNDSSPVRTRLNESYLQRLAAAGNGVYARAASSAVWFSRQQGLQQKQPEMFALLLALICLLSALGINERAAMPPLLANLQTGLSLKLLLICFCMSALSATATVKPPRFIEILRGSGRQPAEITEDTLVPTRGELEQLNSEFSYSDPYVSLPAKFRAAILHEKIDEQDAAFDFYEDILRHPDTPRELRAAAAVNLGVLRQQQTRRLLTKDPEAALVQLQEIQSLYALALRLQPGQPAPALNLELLGRDLHLARLFMWLTTHQRPALDSARRAVATAYSGTEKFTAGNPAPEQSIEQLIAMGTLLETATQSVNSLMQELILNPEPPPDSSMLLLLLAEAGGEVSLAAQAFVRVMQHNPEPWQRFEYYRQGGLYLENALLLLGGWQSTEQKQTDSEPEPGTGQDPGTSGQPASESANSAKGTGQSSAVTGKPPQAGASARQRRDPQALNSHELETALTRMSSREKNLDELLKSRQIRRRPSATERPW